MINFYTVGSCCHPEVAVISGGSLKNITFPALSAYVLEHQMVFDTGYAKHFFEATSSFPEKFYPMVTPVTFKQPSLVEQLANEPVKTIFISHVHGDHIAGLKDFPDAHFICSKIAYQFATSDRGRLYKLLQGVLPQLIPENFSQRVTFIEDFPFVTLPKEVHPFKQGYEVAPDIFAIALPGHACGHYGLFIRNDNVFLIADSVWQFRTISENRRPSQVTRLLTHDWRAFHHTVDNLQLLHQRNPELLLVPSHCQSTIEYAAQRCSHG